MANQITYADIESANQGLKCTDIKGKQYAEVPQRVKAFRKLFPQGSITTDIISIVDGVVLMKTTIADEDGRVLSTGLAYEKENSTFINKTSYIENCETSSVGRALSFLALGIDTSIASAEEVTNAINNQEQPKSVVSNNTPLQPEIIKEIDNCKSIEDLKKYWFKRTDLQKNENFKKVLGDKKERIKQEALKAVEKLCEENKEEKQLELL